MNLHAWIVAATGLGADSVWRAYQRSAHTPVEGTDFVTYDLGRESPQVYLATKYDLPAEGEPLPDDLPVTTYGETPKIVTIRVFGPNRYQNYRRIAQAGNKPEAREALAPAVLQRVVPGSFRVMREQRESPWTEWLHFDILIHEVDYTTHTEPSVQSVQLTGDVGALPVEVES
jgi:hypothetical protein